MQFYNNPFNKAVMGVLKLESHHQLIRCIIMSNELIIVNLHIFMITHCMNSLIQIKGNIKIATFEAGIKHYRCEKRRKQMCRFSAKLVAY